MPRHNCGGLSLRQLSGLGVLPVLTLLCKKETRSRGLATLGFAGFGFFVVTA